MGAAVRKALSVTLPQRINREFTYIFGYTTKDVINRRSTDLIVPDQLKTSTADARERLYLGQHVSMETVRQRKDGTLVDVSEVSFPVISNGKCLAYYLVFRDISDERNPKEQPTTKSSK